MKNDTFKLFATVGLLFLFAACSNVPKTIFVKTEASGATADGLSWESALSDIQTAIHLAEVGDSIWIAAGKYIPQNDTGFILTKGVNIIGGFKGDEKFSKDREFKDSLGLKFPVYETIISGDRNQDDDISQWDVSLVEDANSKSQPWSSCNMKDNCNHLFYDKIPNEGKLLIDGLKLTLGVADGGNAGSHNYGGAIAIGCRLLMRNCDIKSCYAVSDGGGVYSRTSGDYRTEVENCYFHECWSKNGGGLYCKQIGGGEFNLNGNLFYGCHAASVGGGVAQISDLELPVADSKITNNTFHRCTAYSSASTSDGGGLYQKVSFDSYDKITKGHSFLVKKNEFHQCSSALKHNRNNMVSATGGGLHFDADYGINQADKITCEVNGNGFYNCHVEAVKGFGGGAYIEGRVLFSNNYLGYCYVYNSNSEVGEGEINLKGGGVYNNNASITKSLIANCTCNGSGGGVYCLNDSKLIASKIINCEAYKYGGCVCASGSVEVDNCLLVNGAANNGGGAVATSYESYKRKIFITNSTIANCYSAKNSGAVFYGTKTEVHDCVIYNNYSGKKQISNNISLFEKQIAAAGFSWNDLYMTGCAVTGYETGGRNNLTLNMSNQPGKRKKGMYPYFRQPSGKIGFVNPFNLKAEKGKEVIRKIMNADWSMEDISACGDLGCNDEVTRLSPDMWN